MAKKVRKKTRGPVKEKGIATHSPKTVTELCNPTVESVDEGGSVAKVTNSCPHLVKGVNLDRFSGKIGSSGSIRCEDCREGAADRRGGKHGKKKGGASLDSESNVKSIWVCLKCGKYTCGVVPPIIPHCHVVGHARKYRHPLVVNFEKPQLCWCFPCNMLIQVDKIEKTDETSHPISDVVKLLTGRSLEKPLVDIEKVSTGDGSVISQIKSRSPFTSESDSHGQGFIDHYLNANDDQANFEKLGPQGLCEGLEAHLLSALAMVRTLKMFQDRTDQASLTLSRENESLKSEKIKLAEEVEELRKKVIIKDAKVEELESERSRLCQDKWNLTKSLGACEEAVHMLSVEKKNMLSEKEKLQTEVDELAGRLQSIAELVLSGQKSK